MLTMIITNYSNSCRQDNESPTPLVQTEQLIAPHMTGKRLYREKDHVLPPKRKKRQFGSKDQSSSCTWECCMLENLQEQFRSLVTLRHALDTEEPERVLVSAFQVLSSESMEIDSIRALCGDLLQEAADSMNSSVLVQELVCILESHGHSPTVQLAGFKLLHEAILQNKINEKMNFDFVKVGTFLCKSMPRFDDSLILQGYGLDILRHFSTMDPDHTLLTQCFWDDAAVIIANAVNRNIACHWIQLAGLSLTTFLADSETRREILWPCAGSILSTMEHHPSDSAIQCNAAATLSWLLHNYRVGETRQVDTEKIASVVKATLIEHSDDTAVFGNCLCLLTSLPHASFDEQLKQTIVSGMKNHSCSAKVQAGCLWWMRCSLSSTGLIPFIPVVLLAMKDHPSDSNLQWQGCAILAAIAHQNTDTLLHFRTVNAVMTSLRLHPTNERIQQSGAWFLSLVAVASPQSSAAFGGSLDVVDKIFVNLRHDRQTENE